MLDTTAYITLAAIEALAFQFLPSARARVASLLLVGGIALLLYFGERLHTTPLRSHLWIAAMTALATVLIFLPTNNSIFGIVFFMLSATVMFVVPQREGSIWLVGFSIIVGVALFRQWGASGLFIALVHGGGFAFFGAFAIATRTATEARQQSQHLLLELQDAHRQLQEYAANAEELAAAQERNRLAREVHDTLGHQLTVAAVQLEGAQRLIPKDPDRAASMVGVVREQVREALSELRRTVATLRAPLEEALPLPQALRRLASNFEQGTGVVIHLLVPDELPPLSDGQRQALYRAAQEGLTNAQRHANPTQIWLQIHVGHDLHLLVSDNGAGIDPARGHGFGLRGLRERAGQLGGTVHLEPRQGGGTTLSFHLPLEVSDEHSPAAGR